MRKLVWGPVTAQEGSGSKLLKIVLLSRDGRGWEVAQGVQLCISFGMFRCSHSNSSHPCSLQVLKGGTIKTVAVLLAMSLLSR